jgi:hypothetical protein
VKGLVMRFSPRVFELGEKIDKHVAVCGTCGILARGSRTPATAIWKLGCLDGVLMARAWREEYERLHTIEERRLHDEVAATHGINYVADALRQLRKTRGGDA